MKKFIAALTATAALSLAACDGATDDTVDGEVMTAEEGTVAQDAPDTVIVDERDTMDGDRVSISEDGVSADINDGDTSIRADVSDDPSLEVEVD
ncbi:hypothetical protein [Erythrobacter alti]|uniref:hypothetical protein n=1 Tax=Erythrobacter alti TaxID=1896145 RepID=UPI0030F4449B